MAASRIIPMDSAIKAFDIHLKCHPRTILSAKYGDGKSFFLNAAEKKLKSKYVFLKLYPVNYQVEENRGVFEYIKRDLLFQLYGQEMVPDSYVIPDSIAAGFFLYDNWDKFANDTLQCLTDLNVSKTAKATLGAFKFLNAMREKYDEYKEFRDNGGKEGVLLNRFLSSFDQKGIYETDPITTILCGIVKDWKKNNPRKKICLVFEDMDRIDPAHIFRILNVISAHMDYGYHSGTSVAKQDIVVNKFGVDNIIVCLDYDNLKSIYHHFYGAEACFDGYIGKFCDKGIFQYSIKPLARQHFINQLMPITNMDERALASILDQIDLTSFSLRQIFHAIDNAEAQIALPASKASIKPHKGLYIMAVIFTRMGLSYTSIVASFSKAFEMRTLEISPYLVSSMMLRRGIDECPYVFTLGRKNEGRSIGFQASEFWDNGYTTIQRGLGSASTNMEMINPNEEIEYILRHVCK